jgi:hypothetical protein
MVKEDRPDVVNMRFAQQGNFNPLAAGKARD